MIRSLFFLLLLTSAVRADHPAHAHAAGPGSAELGATAAYDDSGVVWAVHRVAGHIAVSRSEDNGASWSNPVLVTRAPEPIDAGMDARPKIAVGPGGEIYVTWTQPLAEPFTGEILFARSVDQGRTFTTPMIVHRDRQVITHRFDALAVNEQGQVFVAWIDKRDQVAAKNRGQAYVGAAVYYAVSHDRGLSFQGDYKVADHCCECCRISLATQKDGSVVAFWRHIFGTNIRDHAITTLTAGGCAGDVRRVTFEDWAIEGCPHHGPSVAVDADGQLHGVWFSGAPERRGVYYGRLGAAPDEARRRLGERLAANADVAVQGRALAVVWKESSGGQTRLCAEVSADGGQTWRKVDVGSVVGGIDQPKLLVRDGRWFVFCNTAERPLACFPLPMADQL